MLGGFGIVVIAALAALPTPPQRVERSTRMFGTVPVDHALHLSVRATCKGCHGEGRVGKIATMAPPDAHAACRGCHVERRRGPTACRGCHVAPLYGPVEATPLPPAPKRTAWRELRWCMTSAEVHAAISRMRAPEGGALELVDGTGAPRILWFRVAMDEPLEAGAAARTVDLEFHGDRLRSIRLGVESERDPRRVFRDLVEVYSELHGEPARVADAPEWVRWQRPGTELTLVPAVEEVAPIELWLSDTAEPECESLAPPPPPKLQAAADPAS